MTVVIVFVCRHSFYGLRGLLRKD